MVILERTNISKIINVKERIRKKEEYIGTLENDISSKMKELNELERNVNADPKLTDGILAGIRMASRESHGKITRGKKYDALGNAHARSQLRDRIDEQQAKLKVANKDMKNIQIELKKLEQLEQLETPSLSSNDGYRRPTVMQPLINLGDKKLAGRTGGARTRLRSRLGRGNSGKNKKKMKKTKKK